ncbi:MAG: MaoC family dehydratase [Pseudomonadota bacterium]
MLDDWPRTFEDFAVGDRMATGSLTVTEEEIDAFCRSFDPQPHHLDVDIADASLLGGVAASGWHTAALTMRLIVDGKILGGSPIIGVGVQNLRWPKPLRAGDRLRAEAEVVKATPSRSGAPRGTLLLNIKTFDQHDEIVIEMDTTVVLPTRGQ